ncbi:MAG: hypothetical protein DYG90_00425 [Chloroflexi bacterium CFX6]|nr:hypothetical protein [Chloroflexi bacterium CFX6]
MTAGATTTRVRDPGCLRKYRTEIPNLVLFRLAEGRIGVYDLALYAVYKRTAGEDGECFKSTTTLAREAAMSMGQVVKSRTKLVGEGLIEVTEVQRGGGRPEMHVTICDVWAENMALFSGARTSRGEQRTSSGEVQSSGGEVQSSPGEQRTSPSEPKKEHLKKKPQKKEPQKRGEETSVVGTPGATTPPPDADALAPAQLAEGKRIRAALATWLGLDLRTLSGKPLERLNAEAKALTRADVTAEDLAACRDRWFREHWAGGNRDKSDRDRRPSLDQAIEWVSWCRGQGAQSDGAAIQAAITNGHVLADGALGYAAQEMAEAERQIEADVAGLADVWTQVLASLRLQTLRSTFDHWYARTQLQAITVEGLAIVVAHSRHAKAWLTDRDGGVVARHLAEMGMDVHQVVFIEADELAAAAHGRAA